MSDKQGSARVTLREIDLSQVSDPEQLPQGVPAAVVGPAKRGPAFVPKTFANMQQFGEVFGSIQEVSKESNANKFGPLALNEWMRNAEAGTFLRVLGIGDDEGIMNSDKTVSGAGFVVGNKISHDSTETLQDNPHAQIGGANIVGATKAARTHFLGCFMKDVAGSTFLKDAGIETDNASGRLDITFNAVPNDGNFLLITGVSATASKTFKVIFAAGNNNTIVANGETVDVTVGLDGLNQDQLVSALVNALKGLNRAGNSLGVDAAIDPATYLAITKPQANQIIITQIGTGDSSNTLGSFNITSDVTVVGDSTKTASDSSQTVTTTASNSIAASSVVTVSASPQADGLCSFTITDSLGIQKSIRITRGNDNGLTADDVTQVDGTTINFFIGISSIVGNFTEIADKIATELQTLVANSTFTGLTFTANNDGTFSINNSLKGAVDLFTEIQDTDNSLSEVGNNGSNGTKSTITLDINGLPAIDDEFTLNTVSQTTNAATNLTFKFVAEDAAEPGSINGTADGNSKIRIEINSNIDILLTRIQSAIEASSVGPNYTVIIDSVADTVLIRRTQDQGFIQDRDFVFKLSENFTVIGSTTVNGNFGPKAISFAGGGGGASPIIRGLLMTPQGVVPALDLTNANYTSIPSNLVDITKDVAAGGNLIDFGNIAGSNLIGYEIGKVDLVTQDFEIVLNGFKPTKDEASEGQPKTLTCSFDPESVNYFAKVLNTDPLQIESRGHYLHAHWDVDKTKAVPNVNGVLKSNNTAATTNEAGFCMHTSLGPKTSSATIPDFESFNTRFRTAVSPWFVSQDFGGTQYELFKLHALDDGESGNDRFRVLISNVRAGVSDSDFGSFDLTLEQFDSDPVRGESLISWKRLSLDPESKNFIGRVIGTKHVYYDFDRSASKQRLVEEGDFDLRNSYVRVELHPDVEHGIIPPSTLVAGFSNYVTLNTTATSLLTESGAGGANLVLAATVLDGLQVLPMPFVKTITKASGSSISALDSLAWGVKFSKYEKSSELNDIRFNDSMRSWTKFVPDLGSSNEAKAAITRTVKQESFSLERIAVTDASNIDWATSTYVRSGLSTDVPSGKAFIDLRNAALVGKNTRYLKFRCLMQGGFDGVNIFNKDKADLSSAAAHREANEETSGVFTGPTIQTYKRALDVLSDKSAVEFQLLAIPGMREPKVTDYAITACESRFDAMLVMDIQEFDGAPSIILDSTKKPSVAKTIEKFSDRLLNTSFAASYFPDVIMRRPSNNAPLQVPPSVSMLGVMSLNDTLADPWFAPAGLTRGRLNALNSKVQMNRDLLNDLYDADINPIYEPAGRAGSVFAFGQKTLLQDQSALDRINVRRLLINIRRKVKAVANTLLFEPNRESTLSKFSSLVEPIMSEVQARQGVDRYKVQIDTSTTTQNDVENNTIRGKIYLQPTKSVEFISLDFVVTNSID